MNNQEFTLRCGISGSSNDLLLRDAITMKITLMKGQMMILFLTTLENLIFSSNTLKHVQSRQAIPGTP